MVIFYLKAQMVISFNIVRWILEFDTVLQLLCILSISVMSVFLFV